jgi:hypothetical protein
MRVGHYLLVCSERGDEQGAHLVVLGNSETLVIDIDAAKYSV